MEHGALGRPWQSCQCFHIFKHINPFIEIVVAVVGFLVKQGQLHERHAYLVGEHLVRFLVGQRHVGAKLLVEVYRAEVEKRHQVHGVDAILPRRSAFALSRNGLRHIVDATVLEVGLRLVLHLHDDVVATLRPAVDVVDERSVVLIERRLLLVEKRDVLDVLLALHQTVEEVDDQGLRYLLSEDSLETDIGERIDKFGHRFVVLCKDKRFSPHSNE